MPAMTKASETTKPTPLAVFVVAGLLVPGGGQLLQGRIGQGVALGGSAIALFVLGMLISGFTAIDQANHDVYFMMQACTPLMTFGSLFTGLVQEPLIGETVTVRQQTIGITFTSIAGLLNLIAVCEALRHAPQLLVPNAEEAEQGAAA